MPGSRLPPAVAALAVSTGPGEPILIPAIGSALAVAAGVGWQADRASGRAAIRPRKERDTGVRDINSPVLSWSPGAGHAVVARRGWRAARRPCRRARSA